MSSRSTLLKNVKDVLKKSFPTDEIQIACLLATNSRWPRGLTVTREELQGELVEGSHKLLHRFVQMSCLQGDMDCPKFKATVQQSKSKENNGD